MLGPNNKILNLVTCSQKIHAVYTFIIFQVKKGKIRRLWHFVTHGFPWRNFTIQRYLKSQEHKKFQIGGGHHTKRGWLNGDLIAGDIYLNATKKLPFPDASIDLVFAEHFIEHVDFKKGKYCLKECYRILKKGGKIRLSTPDLEAILLLYKNKHPQVTIYEPMKRHMEMHNPNLTTSCHFFNDLMRLWGHSFIYDDETLRFSLTEAGFTRITRYDFGSSNDMAFTNLERHASDGWMKNVYHLILEAEKL